MTAPTRASGRGWAIAATTLLAAGGAAILWPRSAPEAPRAPSASHTTPDGADATGVATFAALPTYALTWTSTARWSDGASEMESAATMRIWLGHDATGVHIARIDACDVTVNGAPAPALCDALRVGQPVFAARMNATNTMDLVLHDTHPLKPAVQLWRRGRGDTLTTTLGTYTIEPTADGWVATGQGTAAAAPGQPARFAGEAHVLPDPAHLPSAQRALRRPRGTWTEQVTVGGAHPVFVKNTLRVRVGHLPKAPVAHARTPRSRPEQNGAPTDTAAPAARQARQVALAGLRTLPETGKADPAVLWAAASALKNDRGMLDMLKNAAQSPVTGGRARAAMMDILAQDGAPDASDALADVLRSGAVASAPNRGLLVQRASLAVAPTDALLDAVTTHTTAVPEAAAYATGAIARHAHAAGNDALADAARAALDAQRGATDEAAFLVAHGASGAPDNAAIEAELLGLLSHTEARIRRAALLGLRAYTSDAVAAAHLAAVRDTARAVRRVALDGLGVRPVTDLVLRAVAAAYHDSAFTPDEHTLLVTFLLPHKDHPAAAGVLSALATSSPDPGTRARLQNLFRAG